MLNKILNYQIHDNINNLNKINYLNKKHISRNNKEKKEKYQDIQINSMDFFKPNTDITHLGNLIVIENNFDDSYNSDSNITEIPLLSNNIKKINCVYKINYKNSPCTGFGDFIRGCYFLLEFCEKNNKQLDFHIYDNNIKYFLNYFNNKQNIHPKIANDIEKFINTNADFTCINQIIDYTIHNKNDPEFIYYLNNCPNYLGSIYINTINFPSHNISKKNIKIIRNILDPTNLIKNETENALKNLNLVKRNFTTYHIRLGDEYLNNETSDSVFKDINKIINTLIINDNNDYLIISDSIMIKKILKTKYPNIKFLTNSITHTIYNNTNDIKNTLIDFYMMSFSKNIISYSVYPHGSGFSKWCSVTFEIPYVCYSIF
jgi:hypothetical protein